jgi:signal transduction histidine kinase
MAALLQDAGVLIVDDEPANLTLLRKILSGAGYKRILETTEPRKVLPLVLEGQVDIILLDLQMPLLDGFGVLDQLKEAVESDEFLPVLVLTADATPKTKLRALSNGAHDFLTKPFDQPEVVQRVGNLLRTRELQVEVRRQNENLECLVVERTAELEAALKQLEQAQQQMVQQERLHAFGTMASGVAHDFNNALATILGFGEVALRECALHPDPAGLHKYLNIIITAARDGADMVTRLREFYRPDEQGEPRVIIDLNHLVDQAITITQPKWKSQALGAGKKIDIRTELSESPLVAGDAGELREMLTNLIFNAVDAMPRGGRITMRTRVDGDRVLVEVTDTGFGMTEEVRRRCLEPFFSTKGQHGTGLGLAMVYGIIERHGGILDLESTLGTGTTFVISLPKREAAAQSGTHSFEQIDRPLHVLVVDDQPVLCTLLSEYLKNDCHTVVTVNSGTEALQCFAQERFDLVITDQAMPGITGEQLAMQIKTHFPNTPIILLTGFGEVSDQASADVIDLVLAKPVSLIEFRHALVRATTARLPAQLMGEHRIEPLPQPAPMSTTNFAALPATER